MPIRQSIMFFRDPFKLVPVNDIAEIADKFTRNEILSSNEIRQIIGMKPSSDPKADELRNSNLNHPDEKEQLSDATPQVGSGSFENTNEETSDNDERISILDAPISALMGA